METVKNYIEGIPVDAEVEKELEVPDTVNGSEEDVVEKAMELTGGEDVDVAFGVLGMSETFAQAVGMLNKVTGRMVPVGIAPGGTIVPVEIFPLMRKSQRVVSSYVARTRTDIPEILSLAARAFLHPKQMVTQKLSLKEADVAYKALDRGEIMGRAVMVCRAITCTRL